MFQRSLFGLLVGAFAAGVAAGAEPPDETVHTITFEQALAIARQRNPQLLTAQARVAEAGGEARAATVWPLNPQLEASAAPRRDVADPADDWSVGMTQWFELGGQRGDRRAAAQAGVAAATARRQDVGRLVLRDVALAFVEVLYWERRMVLAQENFRIVGQIEQVARERHRAGDTGGLDESVAALSLARVQAEEVRTRAALDQANGSLKALLDFDAYANLQVDGDLRQLARFDVLAVPDVDDRPDVRALSADVRQAQAQADLGRSERVPNVGLGAHYVRDDGIDTVQGSVLIEVPLFDRGQGRATIAETRRARIETELQAARRRAAIEVDVAGATFRRLSLAARRFEEDGLAPLNRSERLATASYRAGAIPLAELLTIYRELVQAKLDYATLLLEAATAQAQLRASIDAW
jgi:cobalt-zinc-cadmium efflux system outer membrane protein